MVEPMSKEEADASVEDMGNFVDFMNEICEKCKYPNSDCVCGMNYETEARLKLEFDLHNKEVEKRTSHN